MTEPTAACASERGSRKLRGWKASPLAHQADTSNFHFLSIAKIVLIKTIHSVPLFACCCVWWWWSDVSLCHFFFKWNRMMIFNLLGFFFFLLHFLWCQQESASRIWSSQAAAWTQRPVPTAVPSWNDAHFSPKSPGCWAHCRGQAPASTQRPPGSQDANPGGSQQTAGVTVTQAQAAAGASEAHISL